MNATETTPSIDPCHHIPDYDDPNRIVDLKLKAIGSSKDPQVVCFNDHANQSHRIKSGGTSSDHAGGNRI